MTTWKELIQAVRSGAFVPFPCPMTKRDLKGQLVDMVDSIGPDAAGELLYCIITKSTKFPPGMMSKERMFFRYIINAR